MYQEVKKKDPRPRKGKSRLAEELSRKASYEMRVQRGQRESFPNFQLMGGENFKQWGSNWKGLSLGHLGIGARGEEGSIPNKTGRPKVRELEILVGRKAAVDHLRRRNKLAGGRFRGNQDGRRRGKEWEKFGWPQKISTQKTGRRKGKTCIRKTTGKVNLDFQKWPKETSPVRN